jgi:hypothetical protein
MSLITESMGACIEANVFKCHKLDMGGNITTTKGLN